MPRRIPGRRSRSCSASGAGEPPRFRIWRLRVESFWLLIRGGIGGKHRGPGDVPRLVLTPAVQYGQRPPAPSAHYGAPMCVGRPVATRLTPRSSRMYRARASPTSESSGKWSTIRPLPRTTISPARQRMSSSSSVTTSPPRRPSRASRSKIAWSLRPLSVDPVVASRRGPFSQNCLPAAGCRLRHTR